MKGVFLISVLLLQALYSSGQEDVLFGERGVVTDKLCVFYDKEGNIYPDHFISDSSLRKSGASLLQWYKDNPSDFDRIAGAYHCSFDKYSIPNAAILNDSILATVKRGITQKRDSFNSVIFLVHGFRKAYKRQNEDTPSPQDYQTLEAVINRYAGSKHLFVEVYWDGMYGSFSRNLKHNKKMFEAFETARENATAVGSSLRRLLTGLPFDTLNVVTHSLGAEVACSALFDTSKSRFPTPANKIVNICLIAPAIGGEERFRTYSVHSPQEMVANQDDNYRLCILYNTHDFVLKKKYGFLGPGPYKYGVTTLGCDCDGAATKLKDFFTLNYPRSVINLVDLSATVRCHRISCYADGDNLKTMVEFMMK